jgi:hypothetical protein
MDPLMIACSCGLDPATETMAVQAGIAAVLSAPWFLRGRLSQAVRRAQAWMVSATRRREDEGEDDAGGPPPA